jgi:hypothetical protein
MSRLGLFSCFVFVLLTPIVCAKSSFERYQKEIVKQFIRIAFKPINDFRYCVDAAVCGVSDCQALTRDDEILKAISTYRYEISWKLDIIAKQRSDDASASLSGPNSGFIGHTPELMNSLSDALFSLAQLTDVMPPVIQSSDLWLGENQYATLGEACDMAQLFVDIIQEYNRLLPPLWITLRNGIAELEGKGESVANECATTLLQDLYSLWPQALGIQIHFYQLNKMICKLRLNKPVLS